MVAKLRNNLNVCNKEPKTSCHIQITEVKQGDTDFFSLMWKDTAEEKGSHTTQVWYDLTCIKLYELVRELRVYILKRQNLVTKSYCGYR